MDSSFKKYRTAFGGDESSYDPSRILSAAMQPPTTPEDPGFTRRPSPVQDPGFQQYAPQVEDPGFRVPQPSFDIDTRLPKPRSVQPQIDMAEAKGEESDQRKKKKADGIQASIAGFASGLSAGVNTHGNFGEGFATALGRAVNVTQGSMDVAAERDRVEQARAQEIENMFFNRSVKLQELAQRRREAEAEIAGDLEDRKLRRDAQAIQGQRADSADARLTELERHNREMESIGRTNAGANTTRAGAAKTRAAGAAAKAAPKTAEQIDAYARQRVYVRFGAMDEKGNVVDQDTKDQIDAQLKRTGGRRNRVQDAYEKARQEATKSTVDASTEDDSE